MGDALTEDPKRPEHYLTKSQTERIDNDIKSCDKKLQRPDMFDEVASIRDQRKRLTRLKDIQSPPPTNGDERTKISKRIKEIEKEIVVGMPTAEEMRKSPPGAVTKHRAWNKRNKQLVLERRRGLRMLHPDSDNPDMGSVEHLRPRSNSLNLDNALIPGSGLHSIPSEQFMENYDEIDWHQKADESASKVDSLQAELDALKALAKVTPDTPATGWTAEKRAEAARHARDAAARRKAEKEALAEAASDPV